MISMQAKYAFAFENQGLTYIAFIDNEYQFAYVQLKSKQDIYLQLISLCKQMDIDCLSKETEIVYDREIAKDSQSIKLLKMLKLLKKFKMNKISMKQIATRIFNKNPSYRNTKFTSKLLDLQRVYRCVLRNQDCPWIDDESEILIQNKSKHMQKVERILRLGIYYICVKKYLVSKNLKCLQRKMT